MLLLIQLRLQCHICSLWIRRNNIDDFAAFFSDPKLHWAVPGNREKKSLRSSGTIFSKGCLVGKLQGCCQYQNIIRKLAFWQFLCKKDLFDEICKQGCYASKQSVSPALLIVSASILSFCVYMSQINDFTQNFIEFVASHRNIWTLVIKCDTVKTTIKSNNPYFSI